MKKIIFALLMLAFSAVPAFAGLNPVALLMMGNHQNQSQFGFESYSTAGTYTFVVPAGVTSLTSMVAIGAGGGGGGGADDGIGPPDGGTGGNGVPTTITSSSVPILEAAAGTGGTGMSGGTGNYDGNSGTDGVDYGVGTNIYTGLTLTSANNNGIGGDPGPIGSDIYSAGVGGSGAKITGNLTVTPGATLTIVVGAGGVGGTAGTDGGAGGTGGRGSVSFAWVSPYFIPTWTEDWSEANLNNWALPCGDTYAFYPNDGSMGSDFIRLENSPDGYLAGCTINSYKCFVPGTPCIISTKMRTHLNGTPGTGNYQWFGMDFLSAETEYTGISTLDSAFPNYWGTSIPSSFNSSAIALTYDTVNSVEITYDGNTTLTAYLNGTLLITRTLPAAFDMPFNIWLTAYVLAGSDAGYTDVGAVNVLGLSNIWATVGDEMFMPWTGNFANESGPETPWSMSIYGGGLTAQANSNPGTSLWKTIYDTSTKIRSQYHGGAGGSTYKTTTFNASSPSIVPPTGKGYDTLKLWGAARSGGTLKCYLRYTSDNSLVSNTLVSGNSSGLTCTSWPASYDVSGITAPFYLDVEGDNTGGSTSAPVILKGCSVSFK